MYSFRYFILKKIISYVKQDKNGKTSKDLLINWEKTVYTKERCGLAVHIG